MTAIHNHNNTLSSGIDSPIVLQCRVGVDRLKKQEKRKKHRRNEDGEDAVGRERLGGVTNHCVSRNTEMKKTSCSHVPSSNSDSAPSTFNSGILLFC